MTVATRRDWGLSARFAGMTNAKHHAARSGEPALVMDAFGIIDQISPDGSRRRVPPGLTVRIRRAWCAAGWPRFFEFSLKPGAPGDDDMVSPTTRSR